MTNRIEITPEMVKLAQHRSRSTGGDVRQEIARQVVVEAVYNLDPELGLLVDDEQAFSREDSLVAAFDVNDVVVNGVRFDVRLTGEDSRVSIPRHLVGTCYMSAGTIVVTMGADRSASLVYFVPRKDWELQDRHLGSEEKLTVRPDRHAAFDLAGTVAGHVGDHVGPDSPQAASEVPSEAELTHFMAGKHEIELSHQREIVTGTLANESSWNALQSVVSKWSRPTVRKTLTHAAVWNYKVESLAEKIQPKFNRLTREEVKGVITKTGEEFGGQSDSPAFRKNLVDRLAKLELQARLKGRDLAIAGQAAEKVLSGKAITDTVKELARSPQVAEIASVIKKQRRQLVNFVDATADELSFAFKQIALQPVYATHSQSPEVITSINEALLLLDACEIAEKAKALEAELETAPVL